MNTTTYRLAALAAAIVGSCALPQLAAAQGGPAPPQRAADSTATARESIPAGAPIPAAPTVVVPDTGLVRSAPDSAAVSDRVVSDSVAAADGPAVDAPARPLGQAIPLGAPVPRPMPTSFLPAQRVAERDSAVSAFGVQYGLTGETFLEEQLSHQRVVDAQLAAKFDLKALFRERGLSYPPRDLYLRLFKQEQVLEVWVRDSPGAETYTLLREYPICAVPGRLGPKTHIDDYQAPEGFYYIEGFNPESEFHLSLRLNYPNPADRIIGVSDAWGGDIYIHGGCSTVGCFPMTDSVMAELYWLAVEARTAGQTVIPVHVFPARLDDDAMRWLRTTFANDERLIAFWENLREGYAWFETTRQLPAITVDRTGRYLFADPAVATEPPAPAEPDGLLGETVGG